MKTNTYANFAYFPNNFQKIIRVLIVHENTPIWFEKYVVLMHFIIEKHVLFKF